MTPLPGGSPGPNAYIPAPWRLAIVVAGILATLALGWAIRQALRQAEKDSDRTVEEWSLDWIRAHPSPEGGGATGGLQK